MKIRVYYEDTDAGGIVYHTNYIKYCERARSEILFRSNLDVFSPHCNFVVSAINAKFIRSAHLGDILEVTSKMIKLKRVSFVLRQEIFRVIDISGNSKNELLFTADISVACLNNGKPQRIDDELAKFLLSSIDSDGLVLSRSNGSNL
ncbi:YbgC/FadM family acyl-CoA thioesterase [Campylobacter sp. faydin G-140]|uniref:YbgC/FadM family acyl-CoA thioesterase n=1 Tax=Campylobacter anatolicus TaxID=2829105 RepID=UPI001B9D1E9D|nr:YbgC/FadM family acyl-CoA thioesterase [Campylobacter anatolicus]MBR8462679.1 YbgC/FadM family acyl-CoA thioesterase [Campylobacter anatolicus]MBR8466058.1 YbgC/FadM family acyl-CoA thioesterase [Campylobacter anatolicus]